LLKTGSGNPHDIAFHEEYLITNWYLSCMPII